MHASCMHAHTDLRRSVDGAFKAIIFTLLGTLENNSIQCSVVAVDCAGSLQQNNSSTQGSFDRFVNSLMH